MTKIHWNHTKMPFAAAIEHWKQEFTNKIIEIAAAATVWITRVLVGRGFFFFPPNLSRSNRYT